MKISQNEKENIRSVISQIETSSGISIRLFEEDDFISIQKLYEKEGWLTAIKRPEESLMAWKNSHPALVAVSDAKIVGVIRGLTDKEITTYIVELLISEECRGKGIGKMLINACHLLYPETRLEVLGTESSKQFYKSCGFRDFHGFRKSAGDLK